MPPMKQCYQLFRKLAIPECIVDSLLAEDATQPVELMCKPVTVQKATSSPKVTTQQENAKQSLAPTSMSLHPKALTNG